MNGRPEEGKEDSLIQLEASLQSMIAEDNLYWIRNDAKFRAVKQTSSYREFQNFVQTAHLKPIDPDEKRELAKSKRIWNTLVKSKDPAVNNKIELKTNEKYCFSKFDTLKITKMGQFMKVWKELNSPDQYQLLLAMISNEESLQVVLSNEVPADILGDIPSLVLQNVQKTGQENDGLRIMETFSKSPRFDLNKIFFRNADLDKTLQELQDILEKKVYCESIIEMWS